MYFIKTIKGIITTLLLAGVIISVVKDALEIIDMISHLNRCLMKNLLIGIYHSRCFLQPTPVFHGEVIKAAGNTCMKCKSSKYTHENPVQAYYNVKQPIKSV